MDILTCEYDSPCGVLVLGSFGDELCLCDWKCSRLRERNLRRVAAGLGAEGCSEGTSEVLSRAGEELDGYFALQRTSFDIPLCLVGTEFQKRVWDALASVPYGETRTYADIADSVGCRSGVRAVAGAIGANAISIFVPCHRIVGSDGALRGYAGGVPAKRMLLEMESSTPRNMQLDGCACGHPVFSRQAVESAYCIFHQKQRVYEHSANPVQLDDIEYAVSSYAMEMDRGLYGWLSSEHKGYLMEHSTFGADLQNAVSRLERLLESLAD